MTEILSREMTSFGTSFDLFTVKIICVLQNMTQLLCTGVGGLTSGFAKHFVHVSLVFLCREMSCHIRRFMLSVMLECVRWNETMLQLLYFTCLLS
jgi:hypothetical protein